jgi:hypothetical protein
MGTGLLVFADAGLNSAAQTNRGQTSFDTASAGMQAAKQQLMANTQFEDYDGGVTPDVQWSSSKGGMNLSFPGDLGSANVTITYVDGQNFAVVSTGTSGDAKRKIAATVTTVPQITTSIPSVYFSWNNLTWSGGGGGCNIGTSIFVMGNADIRGNFNACTNMDMTYGLWAASGSGSGPYPNAGGSYPNFYNETPRTVKESGIGARGKIVTSGGASASVGLGTRSFDSTTNPKIVADYSASNLAKAQKIAFPFNPAPTPPASDMETLRQRALLIEKQKGTPHYYDAIPGNGIRDAGMTSSRDITTWPSGTDYETVVFYEFAPTTSVSSPPTRTAAWKINGTCSTSSPYKGALAVENGNVSLGAGVGGFNGAVVMRGGGKFTSSGTSCLTGYINSDGLLDMGGSFQSATVPPLTSLSAFEGSISTAVKDWREVYP